MRGRDGVSLIDPGVHGDEPARLANDLSDSGQTVAAGLSTHPHWARVSTGHPGSGRYSNQSKAAVLVLGSPLEEA